VESLELEVLILEREEWLELEALIPELAVLTRGFQ
jgi:hypothetical protein